MRKIIYTRPDGGLSVVHPVINTYPKREEITEEEAEQRSWDRLPKDAINPRFVGESEIPTDRAFRNAWEDNGGVKVNMPKAREIHKIGLRELRAPKLAALDIEYQRADERGDSAAKVSISRKKQALRDVTTDQRISAAATIDELKAAIPDALK